MGSRIWRLLWLTVVVSHAMLAAAWWWLQPGGFSLGHPRFWSNRVAPLAVLGLSAATLWALHRERTRALRLFLPSWSAAWTTSALTARLMFPVTLAWLWLVPMAGAAAMGLAAVPAWRRPPERAWAGCFLATLGSALIGAGLTWSQHVPNPKTHPLNSPLARFEPESSMPGQSSPGNLHLDSAVMVQTYDGSVTVRLESLMLTVQPLLAFLSQSPDGCPIVFVRAEDRNGPEPRLRGWRRQGERSCALYYDFRGQGPATLEVSAVAGSESIALEAVTRLGQAVYSHLNSFCDFEVREHHRLALEFSPCPGVPVEVQPFDYPAGRPVRFAFVEQDRTFRVVEASRGEKGPFRTLAIGRLATDEILTIGLRDQDQLVGRIALADWSSQADTTLSPTGGWGVPVNAIEFSVSGNSPSSPASIFITLAGTSIGRGWDCVGHAAGTYRNRIRIESAANPGASLDATRAGQD